MEQSIHFRLPARGVVRVWWFAGNHTFPSLIHDFHRVSDTRSRGDAKDVEGVERLSDGRRVSGPARVELVVEVSLRL